MWCIFLLLYPGVDHLSDYNSGMECPSGDQIIGRVVGSTYYEKPTRSKTGLLKMNIS
jgi:hypothetical protein